MHTRKGIGNSIKKEVLSRIIRDPGIVDPALISPQLPAPPPARRPQPYGSESRAYSSEREVEFTLDSEWNDGMTEYRRSAFGGMENWV
jgi:hypothetical protein